MRKWGRGGGTGNVDGMVEWGRGEMRMGKGKR